MRRQRVDWPIIFARLGTEPPAPRVVHRSMRGNLASLLTAFDEMLALDDADAIVRRAVEIARDDIGFWRVGISLVDRSRNVMLGTWGSDLRGHTIDEHHIMYGLSESVRETFRRAAEEGARFTVFEDCAIVDYGEGEPKVLGRSWVACTPIRSHRTTIGMMFNDTGVSGEPVDEVKQARATILCSLLGVLLEPVRGLARQRTASAVAGSSRAHQLVGGAIAILDDEPGISTKDLAQRLDVSGGRLARVFGTEMGLSLVEYRSRLRLDRFDRLVASGDTTLLDAALAAGFGSYAQFHRVFRAFRRVGPREYLRRAT